MNTRRHLTDEQRHLGIARLRVGGRQSDVARELGVSQSVISRLLSRRRTTGTVHDRPRSGAPRVTDRNDDQYLRTYALRHRYASATELQARLRDVRGTRVSRQTIRNRLHRFGLNARRPLQVTPLTPRHRRVRLQWAQDHVTWTMQQWSTVLFTDECQLHSVLFHVHFIVPCHLYVCHCTMQIWVRLYEN
uniref:Transposase Tc1-like domain-containing protein n=1 Tax=Stegastes partitus TaxID=144197 RepID=A0A3B5AE63_9TELE